MAAERTIRIKFDGSSEGLVAAAVAAKAEIKSLSDDAKKRSKALNDFSAGIGNAAKGLTSLASNMATASTALNALPAAVGAVYTLAGALPLAVAGGFALAGVMTTIKLGADGAKRAFDKLTPTLDTLKAKVSSSFEKALNPAVANFAVVLPKLTSGFQQIASAVGGVATKVSIMLKTSSSVGELQDILSGTARVVQNIGKFIAPVISAFLLIGATAMPILVDLTSNIGNAGQAFLAFVQHASDTGNLDQWIHGAIDAFKQIFGVLGDLGSIVSSVFGAIQDAGGGSFGFIGPLIKTVREFLDSAQGHDTLVAVFQALNSVAGSLSKVVGALLVAIAPAIPPLVTAFASLATTVANLLVPAIGFLAPLLLGLATFIQQNTSWITPLVVAIGAWALAQKLLSEGTLAFKAIQLGIKVATIAWTAAQWLLNAALSANPIGLLVLAIGVLIAIVALIIANWEPIKTFFIGLWNTIKDAVTVAAQWIWQRLVDAWNFIKGVWNGAVAWFEAIWIGIKTGVSIAINNVKTVFSNAWSFIKGVWGSVGSFFSGIWSGIGNGLKGALNGAIRLLNGAIHGINRITGVVGIPGIPDIPYLAKGGTARGGRPYIVGERGPELFVPGQTGRVVSHDQSFGGTQTVNLTLDLGEGITQRVALEIDRNSVQVRRLAGAGTGRRQ